MAGPIPMGPFTMPMYRDWVPKTIRPWIYLIIAFIFQLTGGIYLGALSNMMGSTSLMREDIMMVGLAGVVGVNMPFPLLFRFKFRFTNRQLLLTATSVIMVCNWLCMHTTSVPLLCALSYIACFFKLCGTFECLSNIQLWMTPKRDFSIFFPLIYIIVLGDMVLSGWIAQTITYYLGSWYMMHWFMIGVLLVVLLTIFCLTKNFRFMKPLPLISVDWLGCLLWSALMLEVIFIFTYGEYYNWWDGLPIRQACGAFVVTLFFCIGRMTHIRHPYIAKEAWQYKTLVPLLAMFFIADLMNSTPHALQNVLTSAVLHYDAQTTNVLNLYALSGTILGCLTVLLWMRIWRQLYTRLLIVGFIGLLAYQVMMYFYISPALPLERLYLPAVVRSFGFAVFFTTLTIYLQELMPFHHFFMGLTMAGLVRNGVTESIMSGAYGYALRYKVAENIIRAEPMHIGQTLMVTVKQLYGVTCIIGCMVLLLLMLYNVEPVRSTLKKMPYWNVVGRTLRKQLRRRRPQIST